MDAKGRIDAAARRLAGSIPRQRRSQTVTTYGTVLTVEGSSMSVEVAGTSLTVPCTSWCRTRRGATRRSSSLPETA